MDLRQQKTRRSIINAFLALRIEKPIEKITVRELSERAEIHKATFYLHYHDIFELSETLEQEVIDDVFNGLSDPLRIVTDPERFNEELYCLIMAHESMMEILFSGSRKGVFIDRLEKRIKDYIFEIRPEYKNDLEKNVVFTYLIHGGYHAYMQYRSEDPKTVMLVVNQLASAVLRLYTGRTEAAGEQDASDTEPAL